MSNYNTSEIVLYYVREAIKNIVLQFCQIDDYNIVR